jgi:hypothetical protein
MPLKVGPYVAGGDSNIEDVELGAVSSDRGRV